jgi:hypothetical protein
MECIEKWNHVPHVQENGIVKVFLLLVRFMNQFQLCTETLDGLISVMEKKVKRFVAEFGFQVDSWIFELCTIDDDPISSPRIMIPFDIFLASTQYGNQVKSHLTRDCIWRQANYSILQTSLLGETIDIPTSMTLLYKIFLLRFICKSSLFQIPSKAMLETQKWILDTLKETDMVSSMILLGDAWMDFNSLFDPGIDVLIRLCSFLITCIFFLVGKPKL